MNPPVEAPASSHLRSATRTSRESRAPASFSPPRDTKGAGGAANVIETSGETRVAGFVTGMPLTTTFPSWIARPASEREATSPRRTSSASRRRGLVNLFELRLDRLRQALQSSEPCSVVAPLGAFELLL